MSRDIDLDLARFHLLIARAVLRVFLGCFHGFENIFELLSCRVDVVAVRITDQSSVCFEYEAEGCS